MPDPTHRRVQGDLIAIRAIPKDLRGFAHDEDDEQMLRTANWPQRDHAPRSLQSTS